MWRVRNVKNGDDFRVDNAQTAMALFDVLKREGYTIRIISPCGTTVNSC